MNFSELSIHDKISLTKGEFCKVVQRIFEDPESLKTMVSDKIISNDQSKNIFKMINTLNSKSCACCRKFDSSKLQINPIEPTLDPLLEIAQANVKLRKY